MAPREDAVPGAQGLMTHELSQQEPQQFADTRPLTKPLPRPLLTIAIPTYNRARLLNQLLSVLFDQLVAEPRVELIVSDNASPDETPAVVQEFQQRGLRIRYIRNETNRGPDGNILQCFEEARGKYVWVFGDDDILVPGGVARVLACLQGKDYDLVYVSSYALAGPYTPRAPRPFRDPAEITDVRSFVSRVNVSMTFISGNIVNKDRAQTSKAAPFATLVGTNLVQLGWTYTALNRFTQGLYIHEELVGGGADHRGGYRLFEVFGPNLKMVTTKWLQSEALRRRIINGTLQAWWPGMLLEQRNSTGPFEMDVQPNQILTPTFRDNFRYWIFVYPIMALPIRLAAYWLRVGRILNRADRALGFPLK